MLERTLVFVDTSYLLASFYNSWDTGARSQLEIDLPEVVNTLGEMITQQLNQPIHRQYWYDGIPDSGPHRYQRALRTCNGVQLRTGQLIEWGERRTQKGVDTRLVTDIVVNALRGQFTDFVLVSGDADMIPGVEEATNAGVRVHLYGFGWDSMSSALRHVCDSTTILDPREDFCDAMQLRVLEGPLPPTIRERPIDDAEPIEQFDGMTAVPDPHGPKFPSTSGADSPDEAPAKVEIGIGEAFPERTSAAPKPGEEKEPGKAPAAAPTPAPPVTHEAEEPSEVETELVNSPFVSPAEKEFSSESANVPAESTTPGNSNDSGPKPTPKPSMMAPRRKLRSRYLPLPEEVWSSAGFQTPFDVGQQYATWWYENVASGEQRDKAHTLSGGGLPAEIDRPLLQFACETLHEYTLSENQRVNLRDGFHSGIRGLLINIHKD
ncbi:NYN domain-containing protein [Corynebacterium sp. S7]